MEQSRRSHALFTELTYWGLATQGEDRILVVDPDNDRVRAALAFVDAHCDRIASLTDNPPSGDDSDSQRAFGVTLAETLEKTLRARGADPDWMLFCRALEDARDQIQDGLFCLPMMPFYVVAIAYENRVRFAAGGDRQTV